MANQRLFYVIEFSAPYNLQARFWKKDNCVQARETRLKGGTRNEVYKVLDRGRREPACFGTFLCVCREKSEQRKG